MSKRGDSGQSSGQKSEGHHDRHHHGHHHNIFSGLFSGRGSKRSASAAAKHSPPPPLSPRQPPPPLTSTVVPTESDPPFTSDRQIKHHSKANKHTSPSARRRPSLFGFGFGLSRKGSSTSSSSQPSVSPGASKGLVGAEKSAETYDSTENQSTSGQSGSRNSPATPPRKQSKSSIVSIGFLQQLHQSLTGGNSTSVATTAAATATAGTDAFSPTPPRSPILGPALGKQRSPTTVRRNSKGLISAFNFFTQADQQQKQHWFQSQRQSKRSSITAITCQDEGADTTIGHNTISSSFMTATVTVSSSTNTSTTNTTLAALSSTGGVPNTFSTINESFAESIPDSDNEVSELFASISNGRFEIDSLNRPTSPMPYLLAASSSTAAAANATLASRRRASGNGSDRNNNDLEAEVIEVISAVNSSFNVAAIVGAGTDVQPIQNRMENRKMSDGGSGGNRKSSKDSVVGKVIIADLNQTIGMTRKASGDGGDQTAAKRKEPQVPSQAAEWEDTEGRAYELIYGQVGGKSIGFEWEPSEETDGFDGSDFSMYENRSGLAEDMKFLASMPELCDITFLVGETREPVCAVRAVLGSRSR